MDMYIRMYDELKKNYLKSGDARSLIHFVKSMPFGSIPSEEQISGMVLSIQNKDWLLFKAYTQYVFEMDAAQLKPVVEAVQPEDLHRVLGIFDRMNWDKNHPETMLQLIHKSTRIKNTVHRNKVGQFVQKKLAGLSAKELYILMKRSSKSSRSVIKPLFEQKRHKQLAKVRAVLSTMWQRN